MDVIWTKQARDRYIGMQTWVLANDVISILRDGMPTPATADEVYSEFVENSGRQAKQQSEYSDELSQVIFSSLPVHPTLILRDSPSTLLPEIVYEGKTQQGETIPMSPEALAAGHVAYGSRWHPISIWAHESIIALLKDTGLSPELHSTPTSLKCWLALKRAAVEGDNVVDQLSDHSLKKLLTSTKQGEVPANVLATLYPYQLDGWRWLRFIISEQFGGLLADEMGLGKTLQVISALRDSDKGQKTSPALVVAPGSLLENWVREVGKFCPDLSVLKHHGAIRTGAPKDLQGYDIVVVSYETVTRDLSLLQMILWEVVILDEAQNIKNPDALRTRSVKQLRRKTGLAVTGTPVENKLRDLWSIFDFIVPGYLGEQGHFESSYSNDPEAATDLEPLISPLMLRRVVGDVATDLPDRIDIPEFIELSELEAARYDEIRQEIAEEYGQAASLVSIGKLRQFCAHPLVTDKDRTGSRGDFSKFSRLIELLEEIFSRNEKVLIFTSFTAMADLIKSQVESSFGAFAATLDGRLEIDARQHLIDQFTDYLGPGALILNPRAGGAGLNITTANHVIHYNPEWNPALEDQASARAYRRGQTLPVTIRRLITLGTVEEVIDERIERKRAIASAAVIGIDGADHDYEDIVAALERSPRQGDNNWK